MNHIPALILAVGALAAAIGCTEDEGTSLEPRPVIDAWIEDGGFPVVKLTRSLPIMPHYQPLDSLERYVVRWQHVTVADGETEVVLTGKYDDHYFPPYIYTTTRLRGQAGRTYTLRVQQPGGADLQATATIPPPAEVDSFSVRRLSGSDSLCSLTAWLSVPPTPQTYYRLSTLTGTGSRDFRPSLFGVFCSDQLPADGRVTVNRGRTNTVKDYTPYFTLGDTVVVCLSRIDADAWAYWRALDDMISLARVPLIPATTNMPSAFSGAYGYWQGLGSSYYTVVIAPSGETAPVAASPPL